MIIVVYPLAFAIVGLLIYLAAKPPKIAEVGRILLFCGVLILAWILADGKLKL